ncbi:MAG TPA: DUF3501 family protein [Myxococcota bacterium]|nr:DUF3501 family protein [Myxococcota bacterium]
MRPLRLEEIADRESYARLRDAYRRAVIEHKRARRMAVGELVTLLFEDRETLRFQVQEMLWVEHIDAPAQVQHELDVYNELMPGERELSATLFVEIEEQARIRPELDRLVGIDEHVALVLGAGADAARIRATFDPKQRDEDRISAVQYIRFSLADAEVRRLADAAVRAAVAIDHPNYRCEAELPDALRRSLAAGLQADPAPLLAAPAAPPQPDALLFEIGALQVFAKRGNAADLWVVAGDLPAQRWLDGETSFGADLEEALRRAVRQVAERTGGVQVEARLAGDGRLCWRVAGRPHR